MSKTPSTANLIELLSHLVNVDTLPLNEQLDFDNLCRQINSTINSDFFSFTLWNETQNIPNPVFISHNLAQPEEYLAQIELLTNRQTKDNLKVSETSFTINMQTAFFLGFRSIDKDVNISLAFLRYTPFKPTEMELISILSQLIFSKIQIPVTNPPTPELNKSFTAGLQNEFISIITHDMRNPLGCIKGYVTTLMREDVDWPKETQQQFLQIINNETDRLGEMITNFLETSRIQSGEYELNYETLSINELLYDIREQNTIKHPDFTITLNVPNNEKIVFLDKRKVSHAIQNLIENAVKHANISEIWIKIINNEKGVTIELEDHGEGIPVERISNIFNRFSRVPKIAPGTHGSGLGLYICREIITRHGGTILADSSPGTGTKFIISLPTSPIDSTQ